MKLSIVATLYLSAPYVNEFCNRAGLTARELVGDDYEIILVNDGSPDNSLEIAANITKQDKHLTIVDLSRNFGHHKAMMTGLAHAQGEKVFLIDSDLEEEPEWLTPFWRQMEAKECDVVYGVQEKRKGGLFERISGAWFYYFLRLLSGLSLPQNIVTARLMTRRYVDALLLHKEREIMIAGLWVITGFDQQAQSVKKLCRSKTTYTFIRKMSIILNSVTSFSNAPLIGIFYIGLGISAVASFYMVFVVLSWAFLQHPVEGWTSIMASIWLIGGMIISFIGIVGLYLSKIFIETKQRPYTIVRQIYGRQKKPHIE